MCLKPVKRYTVIIIYNPVKDNRLHGKYKNNQTPRASKFLIKGELDKIVGNVK